ncbi:hypothetical protein BH10ACT2_BH10ACT2_14190 [soil metagenome]
MNRSVTFLIGISLASATLGACASAKKVEADFCSVVARTATAQQEIVGLLNPGDGATPLPDDVKSALTTFRGALSEMASGAPAEIADDMVFVVNAFTAFDLGLQKVDYDYDRLRTDPAAAEAAQADMAAMDDPATQDAMAAVDAYSLTKCGIVLKTSRGA